MKHSDKTFMGMTSSGKNAEDVIEMCKILLMEKYIYYPKVLIEIERKQLKQPN